MMAQQRVHAALLGCLALSSQDFASSAPAIHRMVSSVLAQQLRALNEDENMEAMQDPTTCRAVLTIFHRLASLTQSNPIDAASLHDFLITYVIYPSEGANDEALAEIGFAQSLVESLLMRKPSLLRSIETHIIPGYLQMSQDLESGWLTRMRLFVRFIQSLTGIERTKDHLSNGELAHTFWPTFQLLYDTTLPNAAKGSVSGPDLRSYVEVKKALLDIFVSCLPSLESDTLLALLEGEANSPDLAPFHSLGSMSLVNQTLLTDAEFHANISETIARQCSPDEQTYIKQSVRALLPNDADIQDGTIHLAGSKGKGKERAKRQHEVSHNNMKVGIPNTAILVQQVISVLPDAAPETVERLLADADLAGLDSDTRVQRVISALLEEQVSSASQKQETEPSSADQTSDTPARRSTFASARNNIFDDRMDQSRTRMGKQAIERDDFLPQAMKDAILAAAARQEEEALEEAEREAEESGRGYRTAAFVEDLDGDSDVEQAQVGRVRVQDDVDEDSALEDNVESANHRPVQTATSTPNTSYPPPTEQLLLRTFTSEPDVFAQSARKSPNRVKLLQATKLSHEQLEGWARMLERDPRKERRLAIVSDFMGSGMGGTRNTSEAGGHESSAGQPATATGTSKPSTRGGPERGRGRGSKGNRGHQGDHRRRGHDRKIQKAGP